MSVNKRIAFIKMGSFSHTNEKLLATLEKKFPNHEIDVIDVNRLIHRRDPLCLMIAFFQYATDILSGKKEWMKCRTRTTYYMNKIRKKIVAKLALTEYQFTFQTQSLFDASLSSVPHFLYTDHTHLVNLYYPEFNPEQLYLNSWTEAEKKIYKNASINFTMSTHVSKSLIEQYDCDPSRVVMARCGSNITPPPDIDKFISRYQAKNILFVGLDWERKGGPQLVEAFKLVLKVFPDATLTIVGCSPQIDVKNCTIIGAVALQEVHQYYLQASLFCLPTRREPFGIVFLEAYAHKLAVVSSDLGALPDIVEEGESGFLVKVNDIELLAKRLITLLGDPNKCQAFGQKGYQSFIENYTWEKTTDIMASQINLVLDNKLNK